MTAVMGGTIVVGAAFVLLNMLSDVLYRFSTRGRAGEGGMSALSRAWLLDASPASRRQARLGQLYRGWLAPRAATRWRSSASASSSPWS